MAAPSTPTKTTNGNDRFARHKYPLLQKQLNNQKAPGKEGFQVHCTPEEMEKVDDCCSRIWQYAVIGGLGAPGLVSFLGYRRLYGAMKMGSKVTVPAMLLSAYCTISSCEATALLGAASGTYLGISDCLEDFMNDPNDGYLARSVRRAMQLHGYYGHMEPDIQISPRQPLPPPGQTFPPPSAEFPPAGSKS